VSQAPDLPHQPHPTIASTRPHASRPVPAMAPSLRR
jgi:hypothetical protein